MALSDEIQKLFLQARDNGGNEYLLTLLRVTGLSFEKDPFILLEALLKEVDPNLKKQEAIKLIRDEADFIYFLYNLFRNSRGDKFIPFPFPSYPEGLIPSIQETIKIIDSKENPILVQTLSCLKDYFVTGKDEGLDETIDLMSELINTWKSKRLAFKGDQRFYKTADFTVLELLINDDVGLFGFKWYFSNGTSAFFQRLENETSGVNIRSEPDGISLMVGNLDELKDEWRVGDKPLYQIGIPGRYNASGEWKPLVFRGNPDHIQKLTREASEDSDVRGCIFYMLCTGHRLIEFVVYANFNSPFEKSTLGTKMHLDKCGQDSRDSNYFIYDGTFDLDSGSVEEIEAALHAIDIGINRIIFSFGCRATWRIKYGMMNTHPGCSTPSKDEMEHFNELLRCFPKSEAENMALENALDWYSKGLVLKNELNRFLSFYIAIEQVAFSIFDGDADFGLEAKKETKSEQKQRQEQGIKTLHDELYEFKPIDFIRDAYSKYILSNQKKVILLIEQVFGVDHKYITLISKGDGDIIALSKIRNDIAHGRLAAWRRTDVQLVENASPFVEQICRKMIIRLILGLKPNEPLPEAALKKSMCLTMDAKDPRCTQVVTGLKLLPEQDWKIQPEWVVG